MTQPPTTLRQLAEKALSHPYGSERRDTLMNSFFDEFDGLMVEKLSTDEYDLIFLKATNEDMVRNALEHLGPIADRTIGDYGQ